MKVALLLVLLAVIIMAVSNITASSQTKIIPKADTLVLQKKVKELILRSDSLRKSNEKKIRTLEIIKYQFDSLTNIIKKRKLCGNYFLTQH